MLVEGFRISHGREADEWGAMPVLAAFRDLHTHVWGLAAFLRHFFASEAASLDASTPSSYAHYMADGRRRESQITFSSRPRNQASFLRGDYYIFASLAWPYDT